MFKNFNAFSRIHGSIMGTVDKVANKVEKGIVHKIRRNNKLKAFLTTVGLALAVSMTIGIVTGDWTFTVIVLMFAGETMVILITEMNLEAKNGYIG